MMDLLTLQLDDLGQGRGTVLAVLAIVLAAIAVVMLRDLFVWFEGLGRASEEGEAEVEEAAETLEAEDLVEPDAAPAPVFVDRRNPANTPTGFVRRKGDVIASTQAQAA